MDRRPVCVVCLRPRTALVFCAACSRAYDRAWSNGTLDSTHASLIEWVARRTRRMERARARRS